MFLMLIVAAAAPYDEEVCLDKAKTQSEMNLCARQEWQRADAALNAEYKAVIARMKRDTNFASTEDGRPNGETLLRESQRAWLTMRDSLCTLESYHVRGGSLEIMNYERCLAEITYERTEWLKRIAAPPGEEGD